MTRATTRDRLARSDAINVLRAAVFPPWVPERYGQTVDNDVTADEPLDAVSTPATRRVRSVRGSLAGTVLGTAAVSWIVVATAASHVLEFSGELGVAGIALTLGGLEAAYTAYRSWTLRQRSFAIAATVGAAMGALLVLIAVASGLTTGAIAVVASGIGVMGISCAVGVYGIFKGQGGSSPGTVTGSVLVVALAYLAQVLWASAR